MGEQSELGSLIATVRRRWFALVGLRTAGRAMGTAAVPIIAAVAADYLLALEGLPLMLLALVSAIGSVSCAAVILWHMQRRPDDRHVARFIEERAERLPGGRPMDDALVSAVDASEAHEGSPQAAFLPLILAQAIRRLHEIDPAEIVSRVAVRRAGFEAAAGAAVLAVAIAAAASGLARAVETARVALFPGSVHVEVLPGSARVPAGTPLRIRAVVHGTSGSLKRLLPALTVAAGGERRTVDMVRAGDFYEYEFASVDRTFTYTVAAGSARSADYTVTALFAPQVTRIDVHYAYPAFAGLAPRDDNDGGDIYAPAGTRVRLRIHADKPIVKGDLALAGASAVALRPAGDGVVEADLVLSKDDSYRIKLADADGLRSAADTEYFIRLMDDRPPDVRILRPSSDQQITPLEEVAIEARADDDYGIAKFDLVYAVAGGAEHKVAFDRIAGTDVQKIGSRLLPVEDLKVKPGDVITYYATASDVGRGKRSTEVRSDLFFLEVKPFNAEFVAAQSQTSAGAAGAQIESLISAQKEIISATWNIERRSQGGKSATDIRAIAQAQTELKARAEQMRSGPGRTRDRAPAPERAAPQLAQPPRTPATGGGDPIAAAIEAMTRAAQQLETERTSEAIPHEMAALNGLLRAQAEVRRRQVSQQANGAGNGGGNRQGQDLSALFDKELQRQQRTNYESGSQVEERPEQKKPNDDALDRIRDLARRQEDLSRRERELSQAGLSAEDMKRQLEKLTREQTELREQAEELMRQAAQRSDQHAGKSSQRSSSQTQGGQQSSQSQGAARQRPVQQGQPGGSDLRDASEQMRSAASQLRRDDPSAAAQASERAAQQLRRAEDQMKGSGHTPARASAELQTEAQQIAQEQRRIAADAERLDKSDGSAASGARRRLADDKERLAGRVDELQRSAQQLAQGKGKGAEAQSASAMADAVREMERERIGQRMRESAKQMRQAADGQKPGSNGDAKGGAAAPTEQQIARAMDKVADTLGGNASADTKPLAEQLDKTREMRDRLNGLEQRMREAEARERGTDSGRSAQPASQSARGQQGSQGREGKEGSRGSSGNGKGGGELQKLQQEYTRELQRAREALGQLSEGQPRNGSSMSTPEQQEFSRSAPGTEAFKQDRSGWESLRKDFDMALEKYEAAASDRLARKRSGDRLSAGGSDRVPDGYKRLIAKYYESLARIKK